MSVAGMTINLGNVVIGVMVGNFALYGILFTVIF